MKRKLRERGWDGGAPPDVDGLAQRFAELGYVDDAAYALSKARSLTGRGYGLRRVEQSLRIAGVEEEDAGAARRHAEAEKVDAALRFAERRRIGPFAGAPADRAAREKAVAAMIRAGHPFGLARKIVALPHGETVDRQALAEAWGDTDSLH